MVKAVIFDLDGTLTDTLDDLCDAVNFVLRRHGFPLRDREEVRTFVGNGLFKLMRRALPAQISEEDAAVYTKEMSAYYNAHSLEKTKPYEGTVELLQKLQQCAVPCAVATNKKEDAAKDICKHFFGDMICTVKGDDGVRPLKPSKDCIEEILSFLQLSASDVLYVGDSEPDAATAYNAGVHGVGVLWGFRSEEQLRKAGFDTFASTCEELFAIIKNYG